MVDSNDSLIECRRDFEAWAKSRSLDVHPYMNSWTEKVDYQHSHINAMWDGWQAAWELQDARVKGCMA